MCKPNFVQHVKEILSDQAFGFSRLGSRVAERVLSISLSTVVQKGLDSGYEACNDVPN
jgi:hypothetical protein